MKTLGYILLLILIAPAAVWVLGLRRQMRRSNGPYGGRRRRARNIRPSR